MTYLKHLNPLVLTSLSTLLISACAHAPASTPTPIPTLKDVQSQVITIDTHVDISPDYMTATMDPGTNMDAQVDIGKMEKGGLDAAFFIVYTGQTPVSEAGIKKAREDADSLYEAIKKMTVKYNDRIELALTSDDVRRIHADGKRVAMIGMENAYPLGMSVKDVPLWEERGVRYMGITHMGHNQFGDSSNPKIQWGETESLHGGLSPLGRELITAMNDAGIMVDVSHSGKQTMMQATKLSRVPIIASHSGAKAVADNPRNLDDEQLLAIKENNGVAQMVAFGSYVKELTPEQEAFKVTVRNEMGYDDDKALFAAMSDRALRQDYMKRLSAVYDISPRASVSDFVDHIDHAVKVAGINHVGIASDFDGGGGVVGWNDATETQNVTQELINRGYSTEDIRKLWGGNLLRVLDAVQAGAK